MLLLSGLVQQPWKRLDSHQAAGDVELFDHILDHRDQRFTAVGPRNDEDLVRSRLDDLFDHPDCSAVNCLNLKAGQVVQIILVFVERRSLALPNVDVLAAQLLGALACRHVAQRGDHNRSLMGGDPDQRVRC